MHKQNLKDMKKILVTVGLIVNSLVSLTAQSLYIESGASQLLDENLKSVDQRYFTTRFHIDADNKTVEVHFKEFKYLFDIDGFNDEKDDMLIVSCNKGTTYLNLYYEYGALYNMIVLIEDQETLKLTGFNYYKLTSFYEE